MTLSFNETFPPDIVTFTSDRTVDFSFEKSAYGLDGYQNGFLSAHLGFNLPNIINIHQVHGDNIIVASKQCKQKDSSAPEADGVITDAYDLPLAVRTADCLPIFIGDPHKKCIGLIHAGWRGTQKEVVTKAINLFKKKFDSNPKDLKVVLGPGIRSCCYKVGPELADYFPDDVISKNGDVYLNLAAVNKRQLMRSGLSEGNICDCQICSCCDESCFSYRREGESAGRMISIIMLRSKGMK